jgi:hypothetical protein
MGWTGCDDTLSQIELTFPSAAAAIAYARRQGLRYLLQGADDPDTRPGSKAKAANTNSSSPGIRSSDVWPWRPEWVERTLGLRGIQNTSRPIRGPAAYYASPRTCLMTTIFRRRTAGRSPSVGAGCVPDRTGSHQGRTAIRALAFGRGDRRTVRSGRDADQHVSAPNASGARL